MTEHEGSNYTKEDLHHLHLDDSEIEALTGHKLGDGEEPEKYEPRLETSLRSAFQEKDDEILGINPEGKKIYRADDPGEIYRQTNVPKLSTEWSPLLNETALKDRRYLIPGTTIKRTDRYGNYRYGWTEKEAVVKRVLDVDNKPIVKDNKTQYMALVEIKYSYRGRRDGGLISYTVQPGETFFTTRNFENKEKWKELNSKK